MKVTGYKMNAQKPVTFLYANNEYRKTEINTIPFMFTPKEWYI